MNRTLALACCAAALAASGAAPKKDQGTLPASPRDGGFVLDRFVDTHDAGRYDGGTPFNGVALSKPLSAKGDLSKDEIKAVVKAHHQELTGCYRQLLERKQGQEPRPQGTALLQFEVTPEGKVAAAAIAPGGLDEATFAGCVTDKVKQWTFPPPRGGGPVKVAYPVKLTPPD